MFDHGELVEDVSLSECGQQSKSNSFGVVDGIVFRKSVIRTN